MTSNELRHTMNCPCCDAHRKTILEREQMQRVIDAAKEMQRMYEKHDYLSDDDYCVLEAFVAKLAKLEGKG